MTDDRHDTRSLILVMTAQCSLESWKNAGILQREWALYDRLSEEYDKTLVVSYGGSASERAIAASLAHTPTVIAMGDALPDASPAEVATARIRAELPSAGRVVVKTNQFLGSDVAVAIVQALRERDVLTALIARGGYPLSRCEAWEHGADNPRAREAAALERALVTSADLIVGTTCAMIDDLAWRFGIPTGRIRCIPNYVLPDARPNTKTNRDAHTILFTGRLVPQKRIDLLIGAIALLHDAVGADAMDALRLDIVGDGPLRHDLQHLAKSLDAPVVFHPREDHAALLMRMRKCAVYVQTSAYEGHPKTVLEAMAVGSAVVVVRGAPGLSTVVTHNETGLLADAAPEDVAHAIKRLLRDASLRSALGQAGADHIHATCRLDHIIQLEKRAHMDALHNAEGRAEHTESTTTDDRVRWPAVLLDAPLDEQVAAWRDSLHGFQKRLTPRDRARLLMALDNPLYLMQGEAAVAASGGQHPKHKHTHYHDFFTNRITQGERVLDLGCGSGELACAVASHAGASVIGVDINPASVEKAASRAQRMGLRDRATFRVGDITEIALDETFDAVVLSNVLEHLRDRPALLARWLRRHSPTRFLIRVPNFERDWRVPFKRELGVEWRLDSTHETEYTRDGLAGDLAQAGLAPVDWIATWGEHWVVATPTIA